jgi:hypothetical protein
LDVANNQITFADAPANHAEILVNYYDAKMNIKSVTVYPDGVIDEDLHNDSIVRKIVSVNNYKLTSLTTVVFDDITPPIAPDGSRVVIEYGLDSKDATNCELIKSTYDFETQTIVPLTVRSNITYRSLVPEHESQLPSTLDVVFSSFVSTGALSEFRGDRDYIYITEAGLWSKNYFDGSNDNGLLAGYRITPPDTDDIAFQTSFTGNGVDTEFQFSDIVVTLVSVFVDGERVEDYTLDLKYNAIVFEEAPDADATILVNYRTEENQNPWRDMSKEENRHRVQKGILRIGENQIAQIVWKIQLGGIEQLSGLRSIYPTQYPEEVWTIV